MTGNQVQRYLRTEELYGQITDMICPDVLKEKGETHVRGVLDALLSQGKIEGRLTAYDPIHQYANAVEHDQLIECWQRIVDGA